MSSTDNEFGWKIFAAVYKDVPIAFNKSYDGLKSDIYKKMLEDPTLSGDFFDYRIEEYLALQRTTMVKLGFPHIKLPENNWNYDS